MLTGRHAWPRGWVEQGKTPPQSSMTQTIYPLETTAESGTVCAERSFPAAPPKPHFDGEFLDIGAFYGRREGCQDIYSEKIQRL